MHRPIALFLLAAAPLALTACASAKAGYPSLARRPIERISGSAPVATPTDSPAAPAAPSPDALNRLDAALAQAAGADARFHQREARARALVSAARGAPIAGEAWAVASVAVADLESARSDAMIALADIDALFAKARVDGSDSTAISGGRDRVTTLVASEDQVLTELRSALAR